MGNRIRRRKQQAELTQALEHVVEPKIFRALFRLCDLAIAYTNGQQEVVDAAAAVSLQMKMLAHERHGHETADCASLSALLARAADRGREIKVIGTRKDPIHELQLSGKLDAGQLAAALSIRDVWRAWGRFLTIAGRGYGDAGSGGQRGRALGPMDVMGEDVHTVWRDIFSPWRTDAGRRLVQRAKGQDPISFAAVVFDVVCKQMFPQEVDHFYGFDQGTSIKVVIYELTVFADPNADIDLPTIVRPKRVRLKPEQALAA